MVRLLWCRTNGSRPSAVGAALGGERCNGFDVPQVRSRCVFDCHREVSPKCMVMITSGEKSRRDVVSSLG